MGCRDTITALIGVLCFVGCQGRGDITGAVVYQDKKLEVGSVIAAGSDGIPRSCAIENGSYHIKDLPAGVIRLAVHSPDPGKIKVFLRKKGSEPPPPDRSSWFAIPEKYGDLQTSGLTFDLQSGQNKFDIKLE